MARPSIIPSVRRRLEAYLEQREVEYLAQPEAKCFLFKVDFAKSLSFASCDYFEYPPAHQAAAPKGSAV